MQRGLNSTLPAVDLHSIWFFYITSQWRRKNLNLSLHRVLICCRKEGTPHTPLQEQKTLLICHKTRHSTISSCYRSWRNGFVLLILETCKCSAFGKQRQLRVSQIRVLTPEHHSAACLGTFSRLWSPFKIPGSFSCLKSSRIVIIFYGS